MSTDTQPLSPRHERFVADYLKHGNATQAYLRAGYAPRGAQPSASRLLRDPRIEAAIAAGRQHISEALAVDVTRLAQEYAKIAFASVADYVSVDENGHLRIDLEKASLAQQAGILELKFSNHSKPEHRHVTGLKLGKLQALAALTKNIGVLVTRPEPGLTAEDRQRYERMVAAQQREIDHRKEQHWKMQDEIHALQKALAEAQANQPRQPHAEEAAQRPSRRMGDDDGADSPAFETRPADAPQGEAVRHAPGMPTEPPPDCVPGHLNGKVFWNTDRAPPAGPTWFDAMRKAKPGGFPGR